MEPVLRKIADVVTDSDSLEDLVRPLLEILQGVSGLESTYLTSIDFENQNQRIMFSRNTQKMTIPEGLEVPWGDTLCKRALEEGRPFSKDVAGCWGDSDAARELGIHTYLSVPVQVGTGETFGTLCGASSATVDVPEDARKLLSLFSSLIAHQIDRDRLIRQLRSENQAFQTYALTDPLTGIPNRRALEQELQSALANQQRATRALHVAFIDLDDFKQINDLYGHDTGDRFLIEFSRSLARGIRDGDMVARYGGDEFVVVGTGEPNDTETARQAIVDRLQELTSGSFQAGDHAIEYAGPSIGIITVGEEETDSNSILRRADAEMYRVKQARRASRRETTGPARKPTN